MLLSFQKVCTAQKSWV